MRVSAGDLDDLNDLTGYVGELYSVDVYNFAVATEGPPPQGYGTFVVNGNAAPGTDPADGEQFSVATTNDQTDVATLVLTEPGALVGSLDDALVIGFSSNALLLYTDGTGSLVNQSFTGPINYNDFAVYSPTPLAAGTVLHFNYGDVFGGVPFDFSGDGRSDVLLQNDNGDIVIETTNGLSVQNAVDVGNPGSDWHVVASADFNADGQQDLLLQNTNGQLVDYLMNGTSIGTGFYLPDPGTGWSVRGTADFYGDGHSDILLQNQADGNMVIWVTDGTQVTQAVDLGSPGASWTVEGVADFNGDGYPDILVQNSNGQLLDYLMNGTSIAEAHYLGYPGPGWSVAGTADYSADGKADILLHNDDGADVVWATDGTTITGQAVLGNPGSSFATVGAGLDLTGDHVPDLVVQDRNSGELAGYTTDGNGNITAGSVLDVPGSIWHFITSNPVEYIDGTGANFGLTGTPGVDQFVLTSFADGLHAIANFDPAQDTIALSAAAFPSFANVQANAQPYMGGTYLNLTATDSAGVVIENVAPSQLTAANFALK